MNSDLEPDKTFSYMSMSFIALVTIPLLYLLYVIIMSNMKRSYSSFHEFDEYMSKELNSVIGLNKVKNLLIPTFYSALKHKDKNVLSKKYGAFLFVGLPGCGKTYLAKKIGAAAGFKEIFRSGTSLVSPYIGMSGIQLREVFTKARSSKPSLLILDELDGLISGSAAVTGVHLDLQAELENQANNGVIVIGTTNNLHLFPPALVREGRLKVVHFDKVAKETFTKALVQHIEEYKIKVKIESLMKLGEPVTMSFPGAKAIANEMRVWCEVNGKVDKDGFGVFDESKWNETWTDVILGKKTDIKLSKKEIFMVAIHELGHAVMAIMCKKINSMFSPKLLTIESRGAELGMVMTSFEDERIMDGETAICLCILLSAGKSSELLMSYIGGGAISDMTQISNMLEYLKPFYGYGPVSVISRKKKVQIVKAFHEFTIKKLEPYKEDIANLAKKLVERKSATLYKSDIESALSFVKESSYVKKQDIEGLISIVRSSMLA